MPTPKSWETLSKVEQFVGHVPPKLVCWVWFLDRSYRRPVAWLEVWVRGKKVS